MEWFIFALLAPAVYALVNFIDKYIVGTELVDYRGIPIVSAGIGVILGTLLWVGQGCPLIGIQDGLLVMLSGMLAVFAAVLYFQAIYRESAGKIIVLMQLVPVFVLGLSVLFLQEFLAGRQILGFSVILLTAIILTKMTGRPAAGMKISLRVILLVIGADLMWAVSSVLLKYLVTENAFWKILIYQSWGAGLGGLCLFCGIPYMRKAFLASISTASVPVIGLILLNETVFITGKLFNLLALSTGPATLVSVLGSTQVFFGLLYGPVFTKALPLVYREDVSRQGLLHEVILATGMFAGICLLY